MIPSGLIVHQQRYRPSDSIYIIDYDSVPTTGRMIPSGLIVHQQRYRPRDSIYIIDYETLCPDYWADDTIWTNSPPTKVSTP